MSVIPIFKHTVEDVISTISEFYGFDQLIQEYRHNSGGYGYYIIFKKMVEAKAKELGISIVGWDFEKEFEKLLRGWSL